MNAQIGFTVLLLVMIVAIIVVAVMIGKGK